MTTTTPAGMESTLIEAYTRTLQSTFTPNNYTGNASVQADIPTLNQSSTIAPYLEDDDNHHANMPEILRVIQYVILLTLLVTGLFGNCLTIATISSRQFNDMLSKYVLIFLALCDSVFLLTQPFNVSSVRDLFGRDIRALSNVSCKTFFVFYWTAKMTSSWLVVFLCFERFIAVVHPHKAKSLLTKRNMFYAIGINFLVMFTYNSICSISSQVINGICKNSAPTLLDKISVYVSMVLYSLLPIIILSILTPQIIIKLRKQIASRRARITAKALGDKSSNELAIDSMIRASVMVLGVMVAYIVCIAPITIFKLVMNTIAYYEGISPQDVSGQGINIIKMIGQASEQINYAVNFYFYIVSSKMFRERLLEIICFKALRSRSQ